MPVSLNYDYMAAAAAESSHGIHQVLEQNAAFNETYLSNWYLGLCVCQAYIWSQTNNSITNRPVIKSPTFPHIYTPALLDTSNYLQYLSDRH